MRHKYLPLRLPTDVYERLDALARHEERDIIQQAQWMLRCAVAGRDGGTKATPEPAEPEPVTAE